MFKKVLVANRGEIAVRVLRTLRELRIPSVAVYSDADRTALHVRLADEAYPVGPAPSSESYLVESRIIDVCKKAGVDGVHPGYGFLSENAHFAQACQDAGITFIGPDPDAMVAMGSKTEARAKMIAADVPVVPGANISDPSELRAAAEKLGLPVMLKASAGGGGKGMRLVAEMDELETAYERAQSEARSAFGDDTVYMEKAIVQPRHIEIQVLGDKHGNAVHLFERDCSIQRRHQKVVEECPSPAKALTPEIVEEMGAVAVRAAKAVNYHSTGTVEFLLGADGSFYFLEMNTRLQVEHPITELTTGFDLVHEQIRVAAGEPLGFEQADIMRRGHAIECRVYAEDPSTGFLPSPGTIKVMRVPEGPGIRNDSGVYEGAEISSFYDPLISKLCVWAPTRERAVARMHRALSEYVVAGTRTNLAFHLALMANPEFKQGLYDTGFIEQHKSTLQFNVATEGTHIPLSVAAAVKRHEEDTRAVANKPSTASQYSSEISAWRRAGA